MWGGGGGCGRDGGCGLFFLGYLLWIFSVACKSRVWNIGMEREREISLYRLNDQIHSCITVMITGLEDRLVC